MRTVFAKSILSFLLIAASVCPAADRRSRRSRAFVFYVLRGELAGETREGLFIRLDARPDPLDVSDLLTQTDADAFAVFDGLPALRVTRAATGLPVPPSEMWLDQPLTVAPLATLSAAGTEPRGLPVLDGSEDRDTDASDPHKPAAEDDPDRSGRPTTVAAGGLNPSVGVFAFAGIAAVLTMVGVVLLRRRRHGVFFHRRRFTR